MKQSIQNVPRETLKTKLQNNPKMDCYFLGILILLFLDKCI